MNEDQIADIWSLMKEYIDKKTVDVAAERYVDMLADHGVHDRVLESALGHDDVLDNAIQYYLGKDAEEEEDEWGFDEEE